MAVRAPAAVVVPTLGESPLLEECLEALAREGGPDLEVALIHQGPRHLPPAAATRRTLRAPRPLGFAAAVNLGLRNTAGPFVALVNDDAVVEPGWLEALLAALEGDPGAAAAQGVNLLAGGPAGTVDGMGIAWNRAWQAVQLGRGGAGPDAGGGPREVFGVSATAALFRRQALERAALAGGEILDPGLVSYYEDVDLACRLRARGHRALCAPAARCRHAGSLTGGRRPRERARLLYGNRHLVLARALGRAYLPRLPLLLLRDATDLLAALAGRSPGPARGIAAGWGRAAARLPAYLRLGPPSPPLSEFARFRVTSRP